MVVSTNSQIESSCVTGMKHIALWIQNRVRSNSSPAAPLPNSGSPDVRQKITSAITPKNVPEFVIPHRKRKVGVIRTRSDGIVDNNNNNPPSKSGYRKVSSLPNHLCQLAEDDDCDQPVSESEFPHLKTKISSYGFPFVSEAPNTNRKESLFMGGESLDMLREFQKRHRSGSVGLDDSANASAVERRATFIPKTKQKWAGSAFSKSLPDDIILSPDYLRRPSSLNSLISDYDDVDDGWSPKCGCPTFTSTESSNALSMGQLQLSIFYYKSQQQLEVKVVRGRNLMSEDADCNSYVKVHLELGKTMKQHTNVVRGNRNPQFDCVLMFKNVSREDLTNKSLRLRVCNKVGSGVSLYNRKIAIGEVILPLSNLKLEASQEYASWHNLESITESQCAARLLTTVELNKNEGQLYITIGEAANLRPTYPPDSYISMSVSQDGRSAVHKQTHVKRNSSTPAFNEVFAFSIQTGIEKLSSTCISFRVMSKGRLRNDICIGELQLTGTRSADKLLYWSNLLNVPKNKIRQWSEISAPQKL